MFEGEATALNAINEAVPDFVPKALCFGSLPTGGGFIVLSFIRFTSSNSKHQIALAKKLAQLHSTTSPNGKFGFPVTTMCGSTEQDNTWEDEWVTFYKERRLRPMLKKCQRNNPSDSELVRLGNIVVDRVVPMLMKDIIIKPAFVHGDLWSGNWSVNADTGEPVIYDPSPCYGHSEFELSIMTMFGSPSKGNDELCN